jgi:hypothetical protein
VSVNDSWTQLGRDEAGRFVSGSPPAAAPGAPRPSAAAQVKAVSYGVIGHLPAAQRGRYESLLAEGGMQRLTSSLLAWHAAEGLDRSAFRDRFLGGRGSDELVDHLRKAASGAGATTSEALCAATGELAAAHQLLGPDFWRSFVATAQGYAQVVAPEGETSGDQPVDATI